MMSNQTIRVEQSVSAELAGSRLDAFVVSQVGDGVLTRSYIQKIIEQGHVLVNGIIEAKNYKLRSGDVVEADIPLPQPLVVVPQQLPLDIVYEDEWIAVVNKAKGMVVHPAPGNEEGTLVNALLHRYGGNLSALNGEYRPGIVHRIDKDTSGLLVIAKNDQAHQSLSEQMRHHKIMRKYAAVVHGGFKELLGTVDLPIGRSERDRKKYTVTEKNARHAVTHYKVIEPFDQYTYVELELETGRTHQIRVHMAATGHPVAGDRVYGPKNTPNELDGQCLHAQVLGFTHPQSGEYIEFCALLPEYFTRFLSKLRGEAHGG